MGGLDTIVHRWLRVPYTLHATIHHPKGKRTVVMLHGIGNNESSWKEVVKQLPKDIRIITIDLLGFGASPKPSWAQYNAKTQARAVQKTLLALGVFGRYSLVGHSLGALVSVELARRYPLAVQSLLLCSPPFYEISGPESNKRMTPDVVLRSLYRSAITHQDQFVQMASLAMKYKLSNPSFSLTKDTVGSYMATLETMIINQSSLEHVAKLSQPITIMRGALDPLVISQNLTTLAKQRHNIQLRTIAAGHEIMGLYVKAVSGKIIEQARK